MSSILIREATVQDIPELAVHHGKMFAEIWEQKGETITADCIREMENAYSKKLEEQIPARNCKAWVVEAGDHIVASGAVSIASFVPVPMDLNHQVAYLHSIYTEKEFRGRQFAQGIVQKALHYCKENEIKRVILNTSDAGRPIYLKLGFTSASEAMKLFIK